MLIVLQKRYSLLSNKFINETKTKKKKKKKVGGNSESDFTENHEQLK